MSNETPSVVLDRAAEFGLVPVVVLDDVSQADGLAGALVAGGLPVAEVTFRTAAAEDSIRVMAARGDVLVGAGTVLTVDQVNRAVGAGARFVVSPGMSRAVVERWGELGAAVLPGVVTATEVMAARRNGRVRFRGDDRPCRDHLPELPGDRDHAAPRSLRNPQRLGGAGLVPGPRAGARDPA